MDSLLRVFLELHPEDAARTIDTLDLGDAARLLAKLPVRVTVPVVERLNPHVAGALVQRLEPTQACELLLAMSPRDASTVLQQIEQPKCDQILGGMPERLAGQLRELLKYPVATAGGMMDPKVASLAVDLNAQQAISTLRKTPREALHYLYVTNRGGELVGVLTMRDLLLASPRDPIEPLVRRPVLSVPATMDRAEVVNIMRERRFLALPVVDENNRLIGVVKHGQAVEAGQLEAFEDMQRMVGAGGDEQALSPVSQVIKRRLPWLYVNLVTAFAAAAVVGLFEGIIAQVTALAVLLPVVSGQGGNSGGQSLAVVMRGLALREIVPGTARRVLLKEMLAGLFNGIAVAIVTALVVLVVWYHRTGWNRSLGLALVIGLAMIVNMLAAALAGAAIPMILRALGRDPAQSAGIFLTTVTDIVGFASFLGFAVTFSSMLR